MSRSVKIGESVVNGITFDKSECYVGDDAEKGIKGERVEYLTPKTTEDMQKLTATATGQALLDVWKEYCYGHGLKARAEGRPEGGGVSLPVFSHKIYGKVNLADGTYEKGAHPAGKVIPLDNRLKMANGIIAQATSMAELDGTQPVLPRYLKAAIEQWVAAKAVAYDKAGKLVAAPAK